MSPLEFATPPEQGTVNTLLYGAPKTGKSIAAGSAPGPVLYLNADLAEATRLVHKMHGAEKIREVRIQDLMTLADVTEEVEGNEGRWGTVVLDPVGDVHRRVVEGLSGRAIRPTLPQYGDTAVHVERFCRHMCELPVNFVIVAHELKVHDESTGGFDVIPFTGTKQGSPVLGAKLMAMVDVIGYTGVVERDGESPLYVAQLVSGGGRRGGDRFNALLPPGETGRVMDLTEWAKAIAEAENNLAAAA